MFNKYTQEFPSHVRVITCTSLLDLAGRFARSFFVRVGTALGGRDAFGLRIWRIQIRPGKR